MIIEIEDYPLAVKLGHYDYERVVQQDLRVCIWLQIETKEETMRTDHLDSTVDYAEVLKLVDSHVGNREFKLIETIVAEIGSLLLASFSRVEAAKIAVEKTRLPRSVAKSAHIRITRVFMRHPEVKLCW